MARKRMLNGAQWMPSAEELRVIELLASGYSQNRVAKISHIPQRTISHWYSENPDFQQMVTDRTVEFLQSQDDVFEQSKALAQLIVHQGLTGERPRTDPALELAVRFLGQTAWPLKRGEKHQQFGADKQLT